MQEDAESSVVDNVITFPQHVSASKPLRDAATAAETMLSAFFVEQSSRQDVYSALLAYSNTPECARLDGERARLAVGETVILLHPPLPLVGVSIVAPAAVGETVILLHPPLHLVQVFQ